MNLPSAVSSLNSQQALSVGRFSSILSKEVKSRENVDWYVYSLFTVFLHITKANTFATFCALLYS